MSDRQPEAGLECSNVHLDQHIEELHTQLLRFLPLNRFVVAFVTIDVDDA